MSIIKTKTGPGNTWEKQGFIVNPPYDDTEIKKQISQLNEVITDLQAELVGVNELANNLYDLTNEIGEVIGNDEY